VFVDDRSRPSIRSTRSSSTGSSGARTLATTARCRTATCAISFAANGLVLVRSKRFTHKRPLDFYLGLAGCTGDAAERVKDVSPGDREHYVAESSWYLCSKR
jgi:hypothetical protein